MRQHTVRHQRVLRLRKTDYTAGHLLAAATANRHWGGGDSRDEGFSYSFEEGRHSRRRRKSNTHVSPSTGISRSVPRSSAAARGASYSPTRSPNRSHTANKGIGGDRISSRGTRSAPRLPSLLDTDDMYGGSSILSSPNLEQCLLAAEMSARSDGGGGGGGGNGSRASSSRNSAVGSGHHEDDSSKPRPSTDGGIGSRGRPRQPSKSSRHQRGGKDTTGGGSSTGGMRGTDASVDSLSHRGGGFPGSGGEDSSGGAWGGRYNGRRGNGGGGSRGEKSARSSESGDTVGNDADLDKIFNPLAFLDEEKGVRVLIQATKPLEVCISLAGIGEYRLDAWEARESFSLCDRRLQL